MEEVKKQEAKDFLKNSGEWFAGLTQFPITEDELINLLLNFKYNYPKYYLFNPTDKDWKSPISL